MVRFQLSVLFAFLAVVVAVVSGQSYYNGHKMEKVEDPCKHFVCTTGKDGRRTFCRVAHVCDKDGMCNFTVPVCASRAEKSTYYNYGPDESVCQIGNPVILIGSGEDKVCNGTADCPMGYGCVDPDYGNPTDDMGVCCLEEKEKEKPPTCPPIEKKKTNYYGSLYSTKYSYFPVDICMHKCYTNYDCGYGEICCSTGCGYKCIDVKTTTTSTTTTTTTTATTPTSTTTAATPTTPTTTVAPTAAPFILVADPNSFVNAANLPQGNVALPDGRTQIVNSPGESRGQAARLVAHAAGTTTTVAPGVSTTTGPSPNPFRANDACPSDPDEVICGQIFCTSDADCQNEEVCCDSRICNKKGQPGTFCLKLSKKPNFFGGKPSSGFGSFSGLGSPSVQYGFSNSGPSFNKDPYISSFPSFPKYGSSSSSGFRYPQASPFENNPFKDKYGSSQPGTYGSQQTGTYGSPQTGTYGSPQTGKYGSSHLFNYKPEHKDTYGLTQPKGQYHAGDTMAYGKDPKGYGGDTMSYEHDDMYEKDMYAKGDDYFKK